MLHLAPVACGKGVSGTIRNSASPGLAVDADDNLYLLTSSGVSIMRLKTRSIEQFVREDLQEMKDGDINGNARAGLVTDLCWDDDLNSPEIAHEELLSVLGTTAFGGLWILDALAAALRLVVGTQLITVIAGPLAQGRNSRDGFAKLHQFAENDPIASLSSPTQMVRMKHSSKVIIFEEAPKVAGTRIRVLDLSTWKVSTLVTSPNMFPHVSRVYKNPDSLYAWSHNPSPSSIFITTPQLTSVRLDTETGEHHSDPYGMHLIGDNRWIPVVSNVPLYASKQQGVSVSLHTYDGVRLCKLKYPGEYAYLASTNTLVLANPLCVYATTNFPSYKESLPYFKPRKTHFDASDFPSMANDDNDLASLPPPLYEPIPCARTVWYPLKTSDPNLSIVDLFNQNVNGPQPSGARNFSSSPSSPSNETFSAERKHSFKNYFLFILPTFSKVAIAKGPLLSLRWRWFRRMLELPGCEESRTRIVTLPSWITPKICTVILD